MLCLVIVNVNVTEYVWPKCLIYTICRYQMTFFQAISACTKTRSALDPLGELTMLPKPPSWLGRGHPRLRCQFLTLALFKFIFFRTTPPASSPDNPHPSQAVLNVYSAFVKQTDRQTLEA